MATLGNFALIFGMALAVFGTLSALFAGILARERFRITAVRAYLGSALMVLLAVVCLGVLLQTDQFTNRYVFGHSNVTLPSVFKFTAIWAGSEGSLLWWTLILNVYTVFFLFFTRKAPRLMTSWALFFVGLNLIFFLVINNVVTNPFYGWNEIRAGGLEVPFMPRDGRGLNPQLQHWAMIIHPPLLYTGYIGFLFPFALALGALISRLEGREWLPMIRRWTMVAWLILGVGIVLGGAWAYMELGWGGYWAWDPVENASFMPWLLATAFLHSIMAQEKRGMFKVWNILLLMGSYIMCLFGTFITRSGLISSVHAFAESSIGNYFIVFIGILTVAGAVVLLLRRDQLADDNSYVSSSGREVSLLFNNVLFVAIAGTILLGVIYPMLLEWFNLPVRELRHGFYNKIELPLFMGMLILMAIGPVLTWKRTSNKRMQEYFVVPAILAVVAGIVMIVLKVMHGFSWYPVGGVTVLTFLLSTVMKEFYTVASLRARRSGEILPIAFLSLVRMNKRRYGGYVVHLSVMLMALGFVGAAFNEQAKQDLGMGESMQVAGYTFMVEEIGFEREPNFEAMFARMNLMKGSKVIDTFRPEQRFYMASESQASEVSIGVTLSRDFYVVLAGPGEGHTNEHPIGNFHIYVNPLVVWVWIGAILMIFGTAIAMMPDLARSRVRASASEAMMGEPA